KACVLPENPASYRVVRTKSYLFNKAQLGQQPIFIWMCYGIFETDLYTETFFCRQKSVSPTDGHFV
ncbi:hypothetical protein FKJ79_24575, partial [Klebsiella pneumoniae]|nr:hypothetical protein [Klebsiella pneumoniae]